MQNLYDKFKPEFMRLAKNSHNIAIAVSGGADSLALALLTNQLAKEIGINIIAITVDHGLREEAANEAKLVAKWLAGHGIDHKILKWDGHKESSNIQAKARNARYQLMSNFCLKNDIDTLAVAHTVNDQAETVLMRLLRGSGVDGLSGISESINLFQINIIRPLLNISGEELRDFLGYTAQKWIEDPSNEDTKYTRTRIRQFIKISDQPDLIINRLAQTSKNIKCSFDYINQKIKNDIEGIFTFHELGFYTLRVSEFKLLHQEARLRSLASALQHISGNEYKPRFSKLLALDNKIINNKIGKGSTLWGCFITESQKKLEHDLIFLYREPASVNELINIQEHQKSLPSSDEDIITHITHGAQNKNTKYLKLVWDNRFICEINNMPIINLEISALGTSGLKSLYNLGFTPNLRYLHDFSIPKAALFSLPVLKKSKDILAVPLLDYYLDEQIKASFICKIQKPSELFETSIVDFDIYSN